MIFCPECGSPEIYMTIPQTWSRYQCRCCGYIGALVIDNLDMAKEIRKEWLQKRSDAACETINDETENTS